MPEDITRTLRSALSSLEADKERIERQISAIRTALGGVSDTRGAVRRRRPMSASARRAVSQRMKAYWAARRAKTAPKGAAKAKPKTEKPAAK